jgi:hypothetical protein
MNDHRLTHDEIERTIRHFIERGTQPGANPAACDACDLLHTPACTWGGCAVSAQQAVIDLNGGRQPSPPKVTAPPACGDDLTECAGCSVCAARVD